MASKELKNLTRQELLEMLLEEAKENQRLQQELDELKEKIDQKSIEIDKMGSIAEASLSLSGVMEAADKAAEQYILNARIKAEKIISDAEAQADSIIKKSRTDADTFVRNAVLRLKKSLPEEYAQFRKALDKLERK